APRGNESLASSALLVRSGDVVPDALHLRRLALVGEADRVLHLFLDLGVDAGELLLARAGGDELAARDQHRVLLLLALLDLFARPVLARIAHRVAAETVGEDLDQRRAAAAARAVHGLGDAVADGEHVVAFEAV